MAPTNQRPEDSTRDKIDQMLTAAGWEVQDNKSHNLWAAKGVAIKEYQTSKGPADYLLFIDATPVGIVEAKREEEGQRMVMVEEQVKKYATASLRHLGDVAIPFVYITNSNKTWFTDFRDPRYRSKETFSFHRPEVLQDQLRKDKSLLGRLQELPALPQEGLRKAQYEAITNLEASFRNNRPRALIQMATGAGKTYTAATFSYRLLEYAKAKRILFLVDTKNLGEQAEQEFMNYRYGNRKFTEDYNVQRLSSSYIAPDSHVCISTIQRLYSILKGEELDESAEMQNPNESTWLQDKQKKSKPQDVAYNPAVPIGTFDFIIIDECHRSIYNLWQQVLDYFDAYLVGLTATPDKRTFGFFKENVVSEYTYEQSVADGVNVPYDVYRIDTRISSQGDRIQAGWQVLRRDKRSRRERWQTEDQDTDYSKKELDKKVVNPSQIRNVIKAFRTALERELFPGRIDRDGRYQVPKTLIFAKTDSHADDIIRIVREEFDEGDEFCKKVTYRIDEDPASLINRFRNDYDPRIAVTVDMIATGTDVRPLEVLLFMRDVKSKNYYEQMKGRGTRIVQQDKLREVSSAAHAKTHFVIVDAVGVEERLKTDSRPLERKRGVPLSDLLGAVGMGVAEEDLYLSLAGRLSRLDKQLDPEQRGRIEAASGGKNLNQISAALLHAWDPDAIAERAEHLRREEQYPSDEAATEAAQKALIREAAATFTGDFNDTVDNIRRQLEQLIDTHNIDEVTYSGWAGEAAGQASQLVEELSDYLQQHKEEITALRIFYDEPYRRRELTFAMLKEVLSKLKADKPRLAPLAVWEAWAALDKANPARPKSELTALIALIRRAAGIDSQIGTHEKTVEQNFKKWIFAANAGQPDRYTPGQMDWLRMLRDHIAASYHIEADDLDYTPFDAQGGRGKMFQLFGKEMDSIINELNEVLVA